VVKPIGHAACALALTLGLASAARPAAAVGVEEWELAADARAVWVEADDRRPIGPGIGLQLQRGFTDAFAVRLALGVSRHDVGSNGEQPGGAVTAASAFAGITYAIDVLRVVPFVELGVGLLDVSGAVSERRHGLGFDLGLGAQYLVTRDWGLGATIRYQAFPVELGSASGGDHPSVVALGLRVARLF
jgi:opacity protein-like surface antigen